MIHCLLCTFLYFIITKLQHLLKQREHIKVAQQYYQLVGSSASECGEFLWQRFLIIFKVFFFVFYIWAKSSFPDKIKSESHRKLMIRQKS